MSKGGGFLVFRGAKVWSIFMIFREGGLLHVINHITWLTFTQDIMEKYLDFLFSSYITIQLSFNVGYCRLAIWLGESGKEKKGEAQDSAKPNQSSLLYIREFSGESPVRPAPVGT